MVSSSDFAPTDVLRVITSSARKQILVLMVAVNSGDEGLGVVAASRVREALRKAERIASTLPRGTERTEALAMIDATNQYAATWLKHAPPPLENMRETIRLLDRIDSISLSQDVLVDLDFDGVDLPGVDMSGLSLERMSARGAAFDRANAAGSRLTACEFVGLSAGGICFDLASVERCTFEQANMQGSSWVNATVRSSSFVGATLVDTRLDGTLFEDVSFRGVDFAIVHSTMRSEPARTRFVRCDLRGTNWEARNLTGAKFIQCMFHGITGTPSRCDGMVVVAPDLSADSQIRTIGSANDVRRLWGVEP